MVISIAVFALVGAGIAIIGSLVIVGFAASTP